MSVTYPFVSVVVLNYNGKKYLGDLFKSLRRTDYPKDKFEIIMGDNASSDDSVRYTEEFFPFVKVLRFDKNYGFCKGNNLCAKETRGQYIVFLNTDTVVTKDWLRNLVDSLLGEKGVVIAGSKMLKPYDVGGKKIIDYAGGKITYELNFYEGLFEYDDEAHSLQKHTGFGCGAAVIVDKKFFADIGGFDEYYFGGGEEVELGLRAWQYGLRVLYVPSSIIYHLRYATFKTLDYFSTYVWVKSMFYFILKNYERKNVLLYCIESILLTHFSKSILFILKKDIYSFMSIMKGMLDFIVELRKKRVLSMIYQKRREIGKNRRIRDDELTRFGVVASFTERMRYRVKIYQIWKSAKY